MSSKKWGEIKLWKKLLSGAVSLSLFISLFPIEGVSAYEQVPRGNLLAIKEFVEEHQKDLETEQGIISKIKEGVDTKTEESQSIIIEFKSLPTITARALNDGVSKFSLTNEVENDHNKFEQFLMGTTKEKSSQSNTIEHSYYDTFNGVSMKIKGTDIPLLLESDVVKAIWKDEEVRVEPSIDKAKSSDEISSRMVSSTPLIGVDKLRAEGITGKGIKVGVLDTGLDYNHPDLKDNYREGGYDFVDDDNDPMETTYKDWQNSGEAEKDGTGSSYYTYHGTHVSGTIGANGKNAESDFAVTGIAPEAEIYGYRVLGPYGVGSSSDIIAAIEQSVKDGMDVINLSLGITTPSPLYPSSIACNNAALAGVVPVVANGNAGPGLSTLGSPGTSPLAISVGASSTSISIDKFKLETSKGTVFNGKLLARPFDSIEYLSEKEYEIVYGGYGFNNELSSINAEGKILLLDRGYLSFADKLKAAKNSKAAAVIITNNVSGEMDFYFGESVTMIPGISMSMEEGQSLKAEIKASEEPLKIKVDFDGKTATPGDKLADFSSRGPSSDETIKPDITAPGVGIFSTYPEYINSPEEGIDYSTAYARIDGTSMASPHIAGVVALMLQNNKDLNPEQVKVAIMNNAEKLVEDYGVNEIGAGRVNAYNAVHSDIAIKVLDKTQSIDKDNNKIDINYITGSISFDRIPKTEKDSTKDMSLQIINLGSENKNFEVSLEYLGESVGAPNAEANGVTVEISKTLSVPTGSTIDFKATLKIPAEAVLGRYQGFIIVKNIDNPEEDYRIPFSVNYLTPGIESIVYSRPAISNDLEMVHLAKEIGISANVTISSPIDVIEVYVRDYNTKEVIGFVGEGDISYLPPGYTERIVLLNGRASYFPVDKDGNIDYVCSSLRDGKYTLEFIANDAESDAQYKFNYDILVDNEDVKMNMEIAPGVIEVSEDMFTKEEYLGEEYEAFWLKGKVSDNSIPILNEMGYDVDAASIKIAGFANGMPLLNLPVSSDGTFKAGIEMSDIENGIFEFSPMATDIATSQNLYLPPRYFLIKKGDPYYGVTLDKKEMTVGDNITATVNINNVTGSSFQATMEYYSEFEIEDIKVNEQLQKILDENQYKVNISKNISGNGIMNLGLKVEVVDKDGNPVNISGNISLLDVKLKLVSDSVSEFYKEYIQCREMLVKDKDDMDVNISYAGYYDGVIVKMTSSTLITFQFAEGYSEIPQLTSNNRDLDKYLWIEDAVGNKYNLFYDPNFDEYRAFDLPKSSEELRLISAMPGHFKKAAKFIPSRTFEGELVGKVYYLLGSEFYRNIAGGDVNGDGLIDIMDALEVEKYYGKKIDYNNTPVDFNFDGVVDAFDMDYIVYNFTNYNEQVVDRGEPQLSYEGRTLEDILDKTGYNTEVRLDRLDIDKNYMQLEVGETDKITATITPENLQGISLIWTSSKENVAKVDNDGNVTAVGPGFAQIAVKTSDGRLSLSCSVSVTLEGVTPEITEVSIDEPIREVYVGDEFDLNFKVEPYESLVSSARYASSAKSIVSVENGKAIAHKAGKAFVTVSINGGSQVATWEITVKEKVPETIKLQSIKINKNSLNLQKEEEEQLTVAFNPENATNKNVTWKSSDEKIAKVVDGKVVAVGRGEAVITVTSEEGSFVDTCKVTVKEKAPETIKLQSIKLNKNSLNLQKEEEEQLTVAFNPENATNKNVTWKSSDEKVVKVVDGKVVAVGKGEAVITVTSEEGNFIDTCKVTVKDKNTQKPKKPNLPQTGAMTGASVAVIIGLVATGTGLLLKKKSKN